jgi:hypothetical protein
MYITIRRLFEIAQVTSIQQLKESGVLRDTIRAALSDVIKTTKYREIWKLEIMLDFIREGPPSEDLSWVELMGRAAVLFMIFIPCRPVGIWRMRVKEEKVSADGKAIEIPTREKTNTSKGSTVLLIRAGTVPNLCAVRVYNLLRKGATARGITETVWCSERGVVYKQSSAISRLLKNELRRAGIADSFPAYSIGHALITFLFEQGLSEVEVNAYTGHSNNSHTALTNYFHLDANWMGVRIAQTTLVKDARVEAAIVRDKKVGREEEGEDHSSEEEKGMSEEDAQRWE